MVASTFAPTSRVSFVRSTPRECRYEEKMRAEGLRRLQDEPADAATYEPITSIEVTSISFARRDVC